MISLRTSRPGLTLFLMIITITLAKDKLRLRVKSV